MKLKRQPLVSMPTVGANNYSPLHEEAEALLLNIAKSQESLESLKKEMDAQIKPILERFENNIKATSTKIADDEKSLEKLVIANREIIMGDADRLDLKTGSLLLKIEKRVKRIKQMLLNLKKVGFTDAIKTVESVNWDELEKWDSEKLALVGTEKKDKTIFGYEIGRH